MDGRENLERDDSRMIRLSKTSPDASYRSISFSSGLWMRMRNLGARRNEVARQSRLWAFRPG